MSSSATRFLQSIAADQGVQSAAVGAIVAVVVAGVKHVAFGAPTA